MKQFHLFFIVFFCILTSVNAQNNKIDSTTIRGIFDYALTEGKSYEWLDYLSNQIGGRLAGSPQAAAAVEWGKQILDTLGLDTVYLQPVMVPHWVRGDQESGAILSSNHFGQTEVAITALGGSVATPMGGITSEVIEISSYEELERIGKKGVTGKIVFYNVPMEPRNITTFTSYGNCQQYRYTGAGRAAEFGASAILLRSISHKIDKNPHTGSMAYPETGDRIPAAAISTFDAEELSKMLQVDPSLKFHLELSCKQYPDKLSYNVIGELKGRKYPNDFITFGGHLDAWDNGDGAHDDGAGVVQSLQVMQQFVAMNYQPERTLRIVLFMNEENGARGAKEYARKAKLNGENHLFALESDAGGFVPRGFTVDGTEEQVAKIAQFESILEPYNLHYISPGFGGVDIRPLKEFGTVCIGLRPDSQRYFDYHHAPSDTFEAVNKRELELGAAAITALLYLIDKSF